MKINAHGLTHIGHVRPRNEDAFLLDLENHLFAVADGLGGLPDGDKASQLAIHELSQIAPLPLQSAAQQLEASFIKANQTVHQVGTKLHGENSIGTTLTSVYIQNDQLYAAHVGDSALYLMRSHHLTLLTEEHTMAAHYGASHSDHNSINLPDYFYHTLTRWIGSPTSLQVNSVTLKLLPSDRLLLCTDGLIKVADLQEIEAILDQTTSLQNTSEAFLNLALQRGAPDNLTLIAIQIY